MTTKRKHPSQSHGERRKVTAKAVAQAQPRRTQVAQPLPPLDSSDDDDSSVGEEEMTYRQSIIDEIDRDNEEFDDEQENDDEDESDELDEAMSASDDEADASVSDSEMESGNDEDEDEEEESAPDLDAPTTNAPSSSSSTSAPPLEIDLPLRVVLGTYGGMLFGLHSKQSVRELVATVARSKNKLSESDMDDDEDSDELSEENDDEDTAQRSSAGAASSSASSTSSSSAAPSSSASGLSLLFNTSAHIGSIKSLSVSLDGKWLVSGGVDECIKIFEMGGMREFGQLFEHTSNVSSLEFFKNDFLISGDIEGDIIIWNTKQWQVAKKFKSSHRGAGGGSSGGVTGLAVHPSGKVALSIGSTDRCVKLWDLVTGRVASSRTCKQAYHSVRWSPDGEKYALVGEKILEFLDTSNTVLRREDVSDTKILSAAFISNELFAIGCEDKTIRLHSVLTGECVVTLQHHQARVRGLDVISLPPSSSPSTPFSCLLASASTDGQTHIFDLSELVKAAIETAQAGSAPSPLPSPIRPICSARHDHRVTLLRFLPHFNVRKQHKQQQQQQQQQQSSQSSSSKTTQSSVKGKAAFERQQAVKAREQAEKARQQAKPNHTAMNGNGKHQHQQPHHSALIADAARPSNKKNQKAKKTKSSFEEAPLNIDMPPSATARASRMVSDDDEDGEVDARAASQRHQQPRKKQKAQPSPRQLQPPSHDHQRLTQPQARNTNKKQKQGLAKEHVPSKQTKPTAASTPSPAIDTGFSASLPLFKPQLGGMQRKKKSKQKLARDAERHKKRSGR